MIPFGGQFTKKENKLQVAQPSGTASAKNRQAKQKQNWDLIRCLCIPDNAAEDWKQSLCQRVSWKWRYGAAPDVQNAKVVKKTSLLGSFHCFLTEPWDVETLTQRWQTSRWMLHWLVKSCCHLTSPCSNPSLLQTPERYESYFQWVLFAVT